MTTTEAVPRGCLPLQPLWEYLSRSRAHGDPTNAVLADDLGVSVRTVQRWAKRQWVGFYEADEIATRLCVHGTHIWGEQFFEAGEEDMLDLESAVVDEEEVSSALHQARRAASTCAGSAPTLLDSVDDELGTHGQEPVCEDLPRRPGSSRRRRPQVGPQQGRLF